MAVFEEGGDGNPRGQCRNQQCSPANLRNDPEASHVLHRAYHQMTVGVCEQCFQQLWSAISAKGW